MTSVNDNPHTLVNIFTPKDGATDRLLDLQLQETRKMRSEAAATGWLGNDVYRAQDGKRLIIVTRFESIAAKQAWAATPSFAAHIERIDPLLKGVESIPVDQVARHIGASSYEDTDGALRLAVITGSTREGRFADKPADWIARKAALDGRFAVTQIDLRDVALPFFGDPSAGDAQKQAANVFAEQVSGFDAYIFTVAEYNHSLTAVLKNTLDHAEWARKPAGMVGYGGVGGARAVEHVRAIAAELEMVTMQAAIHILFADYLAISKGEIPIAEIAHLDSAADKMLNQLAWWARALKAARKIPDVAVAA